MILSLSQSNAQNALVGSLDNEEKELVDAVMEVGIRLDFQDRDTSKFSLTT